MAEILPNALTPPAWQHASRRLRYRSAFIDLVVWTAIWLVSGTALDLLVRTVLGMEEPSGPDPRDDLSVISMGLGALFANLYLAFANGAGKSIGKVSTDLRLVTFAAGLPAKPGLARGLVRSAVQALPYMGAISVLTRVHDAIAGTTIVRVADEAAWDRWWANKASTADADVINHGVAPGRIAAWKIAVAILVHIAAVLAYAVLSAV